MKNLRNVVALTVVLGVSAWAQQDRVPSGTEITVRTNGRIDAKNTNQGRIYSAVVDRDVRDGSGNVVIRRGADAELIIRSSSNRELQLDLESVSVDGRRYVVSTTDEVISSEGDRKDGVGANQRTAKYAGGGAVIGSIIGAIAGGGKGAAIGAIAGGGAGAIWQTATRGRQVNVPAESLLTFRLDRPLRVGDADRGRDRNGAHYHDYNNR